MSNPSTDDLAAWFASTRNALARAEPRIETDRRFGAEGLKVNGRVFAMLVNGRRVVKLPATRVAELVEQGRGSHFDPVRHATARVVRPAVHDERRMS